MQLVCNQCEKSYKAEKRTSKYCSRACSNTARRGMTYSKDSHGNSSRQRLNLLKNTFNFTECMVEGCGYTKTFDIHRYIPGKLGGEYVIGNMYAICPNCHAEVSRGIVTFEKVDDKTLRISGVTVAQ